MWSQGVPAPSMVYQCRAWCTCFHPLRVMCVHQLEAMFSLGLGEGLVPRIDCTGQDWRMSFSSSCPGLQGMLGWFHPGSLESWLSLLSASPQKWVCAASLDSLGSFCRPGPVFLIQLCWRQPQMAPRHCHMREAGPCASVPWAWFSAAR